MGLLQKAARTFIPRGHRQAHIPGWNKENQRLYDRFRETGNVLIGKELQSGLDKSRREEWESKINNLSFAKLSRKSWGLLHQLNGKSKTLWKKAKIIAILNPNKSADDAGNQFLY